MSTINFLQRRVLRTVLFTGDGKNPPALVARLTKQPGARAVMISGANGSGKSLFRRLVQTICCTGKSLRCITLSQEGRVSNRLQYGLEEIFPTGLNSLRVMQQAFAQQDERRLVLVLDEPEIGMADETAAATGRRLAELIEAAGENIAHIFVISHNRHFVRGLMQGTKLHFLQFGTTPLPSLAAWVDRPVVPVDLSAMEAMAIATKDRALAIMNRRR
jgi:predicted ATPase